MTNRGTVQSVILVSGATGTNVGRHVVVQLLGTNAAVCALTHNPESAGLPDDVDIVRGNLSLPDPLSACLEGVEALLLAWLFFTAEAAPTLLDAATKHARRIAYLLSESKGDDLEQQPDTTTARIAAKLVA